MTRLLLLVAFVGIVLLLCAVSHFAQERLE